MEELKNQVEPDEPKEEGSEEKVEDTGSEGAGGEETEPSKQDDLV
jgi:hypothetical protein